MTSGLIGREAELRRLDAALRVVSIAVIHGVAGAGKSALCRAFAEQWPSATHFVTPEEATDALWAEAERQGALVVIDGFERAARPAEILHSAGALRRGRLIVASRERVELADGDYLQLRLGGLARGAAEALWAQLTLLHRPACDFERAWAQSFGHPGELRQAHLGGSGERPLDELLAALPADARRLAAMIASIEAPVPVALVRDAAVLRRHLLVELDAHGALAMPDLVRARVRRVLGDDLAAVIAELPALVLAAEPVAFRVSEGRRALIAAGRRDEVPRLLRNEAAALVRAGAVDVLLRELDALEPDARSPELAVIRARALCDGWQARRAYDGLESVARTGAAHPQLLVALGNAACWAGELGRACEVFDHVIGRSDLPAALHQRAALGRRWARVALGAADPEPVLAAGALPKERAVALFEHVLRDDRASMGALAAELSEQVRARPAALWSRALIPMLCGLALARAGRLDEAEAVTELLSGVELALCRAAIALERGQRTVALAGLREILPEVEAGGVLVAIAWIRIAMARALFQLGRRRDACAALGEARELCRRRGTTAFALLIAAAEREDVAAPGWLDEPPRADARDRLRAALGLARFGQGAKLELELGAGDVPAGDDFGLDRALLALAHALRSSYQGQIRVAAQHLRHATQAAARAGADDDLIPALHRLWSEPTAEPASTDPLVIDANRHELRIGSIRRSLRTRPTLRTLLYTFIASPDRYLSREAIAQCLWGVPYDPQRNDNSLKSNILRLRAQLAGTGLAIRSATEGYVLVVPAQTELVSA